MKWFTNQKMSWVKVILLALGTAVLTAGLNLVPALKGTSFQDIAINLECWILFAVFIIVNCKKWQEAAIKTFVFFLISQPLIYLIQVPFSSLGFQIFQYYKYWFIITILTLPGAVIAYQIKRKDWLSVAVLSVATAFLGYMAADYFWIVKSKFPHHILSLCFCIILALFLIFTIHDQKKHRIAAIAVVVVSIVVCLIVFKPIFDQTIQLEDGKWTYTVDNSEIASVTVDDNNSAVFSANKDGTAIFTFTNEKGDTIEYCATVSGGGIFISVID